MKKSKFSVGVPIFLAAIFAWFPGAAQAAGLGPIFPVNGGMQIAVRPQGSAFFAEAYNSGINNYSEIRVSSLNRLSTNQSAFQGYAVGSFGLASPDIAVNETNGVAVYANYYASVGDEGTYHLISMFRFDTNGAPTTAISNVTEYALSQNFNGYFPIVRTDMNRAGRYAVVYFDETEKWELPLFEEYIYVQLFNANGSPVEPACVVNQRLIAYWPVVAVTPDGGAIAVWEDASVATYSYDAGHDIYARRIDPSGNPIGNEFRVNTTINCRHNDAEIAVATNGSFAIVWTQSSSLADGVYLQRFDAAGNRLGSELRVSPYNGTDPQVAMAADGRFVVAWQGQDDDGSGIFAQRFQADGSFYGNALWMNEGATNSQTNPLLGMADDGTFIVKWNEDATNFARWSSWDATNQTQILGPRIQSMSPATSTAAPITNVTVTFDRVMNAATFATTNAQLVDPVGRVIAVTSIQTTNNRTFSICFASQSLPGRYHLQVGPTIQDANGLMMDEDGDTIKGEVTDVFVGSFVLTSAATASFPVNEGFESGPDSMTGWSFDSTTTNALIFTTNGTPHGGTNHLFFLHGPMESATVKVNMAGQAGQTNLFLSFWAKDDYSGQPFYVDLSGDGQTWFPILTNYPPAAYVEFALDLDQLAASNGVAIDSDVYIRFRLDIGSYLYLDDVRIQAGALPVGPKVVGHLPSQLASSNASLNTITVTFDKAIDPATFTAVDVVVQNPWNAVVNGVAVAPVAGTGNTQFNLNFPGQTLRGDYHFTIGPNIADAAGHLMNQNGDAVNGDLLDYYKGTVTFAPAPAHAGPGPVVFEETFENWPPASTNWSFMTISGGSISISQWRPHHGTNYLDISTPGGTAGETQVVTLAVDLSALVGKTNLFLEFWTARPWPYQGSLTVELSGNGQNWFPVVFAGPGDNYVQYSLDLDSALATDGISLGGSVFIRFRHTIATSVYNQIYGELFLDDVRIVAGNPSMPLFFAPSLTSGGQFQFQLTGPVGNNYVIQASTNLMTWIPIATNAVWDNGVLPVSDPAAANYSRRFYRAMAQ